MTKLSRLYLVGPDLGSNCLQRCHAYDSGIFQIDPLGFNGVYFYIGNVSE